MRPVMRGMQSVGPTTAAVVLLLAGGVLGRQEMDASQGEIVHSYGGRWSSEAASESLEVSSLGGAPSLLWVHETRCGGPLCCCTYTHTRTRFVFMVTSVCTVSVACRFVTNETDVAAALNMSVLLPRVVLDATAALRVRGFEASLAHGVWRSEWGERRLRAPCGARLLAVWADDEGGGEEAWGPLSRSLGGALGASFGATAAPMAPEFASDVYADAQAGGVRVRESYVPREPLCGENLESWLQLLPCRGNAGVTALLRGYSGAVRGDFRALSFRVRQVRVGRVGGWLGGGGRGGTGLAEGRVPARRSACSLACAGDARCTFWKPAAWFMLLKKLAEMRVGQLLPHLVATAGPGPFAATLLPVPCGLLGRQSRGLSTVRVCWPVLLLVLYSLPVMARGRARAVTVSLCLRTRGWAAAAPLRAKCL